MSVDLGVSKAAQNSLLGAENPFAGQLSNPAVGFEMNPNLITAAITADFQSENLTNVNPLTPPVRMAIDIPRGVRPDILVSQIRITAPFLFENEGGIAVRDPSRRFLDTLFHADRMTFSGTVGWEPTHFEYFELCLSAHWATVGTYVPTDVDNQIRFRLWHPTLTVEETSMMANLVLEAYRWDSKPFSNRNVTTASGEMLAGHHGEWFSVAVAAYAATKKRDPQKCQEILDAIQFEVTRHAKVYLEFKRARDGNGMLKAATLIAHNLGDLDRVIDLWGIKEGDALYEFAYKAGNCEGARAARFSGALAEAGRLNKALMAPENHRHLPLRTPKALRKSADFLLPVAPFFDDWGGTLARHPGLSPEELAEIVEALYQGWERVKGPDGKTVTYAYPRAVAGILENFPGGMNRLGALLPSKVERNLRSGLFRSLVSISQRRFEDQWSQMALNFTK